jgi:hypothetical protein
VDLIGAGTAESAPSATGHQMTVFVYVNTSKPSGDPDHIKVFCHLGP